MSGPWFLGRCGRIVLSAGLCSVLAGCGESAEAVNKAAEDVTGARAIQKARSLGPDIQAISDAHEERLRQSLPGEY